MAFVPYVPPQQLDPRVQELGQRVTLTVAEFRQKYPDLTDEEIRQALASAAGVATSGGARPAAARGAIAAAVAALAVLGAYLFAQHGGGGTAAVRPIAFAVAVAAVVVAIVVRRARRE